MKSTMSVKRNITISRNHDAIEFTPFTVKRNQTVNDKLPIIAFLRSCPG
jgi:hypothetical protein